VQHTPGLELNLECAEGAISHTLWLSEKARVNTEKKLREIGVTDAEMKSGVFWSSVDSYLVGKRVKIETEEETYNGKARVKVKWFNADKCGSDDEENLAAYTARFFGGGAAAPQPKPKRDEAPAPPPPGEDDVPF
jgi:hypothetical protein